MLSYPVVHDKLKLLLQLAAYRYTGQMKWGLPSNYGMPTTIKHLGFFGPLNAWKKLLKLLKNIIGRSNRQHTNLK